MLAIRVDSIYILLFKLSIEIVKDNFGSSTWVTEEKKVYRLCEVNAFASLFEGQAVKKSND